MNSKIVICSGGPKSELCSFQSFIREAIFIGVDRGSLYLLEEGITPSEIIGDFDSLTEDEWKNVSRSVQTITKFRPEKDETDTELALQSALRYRPNEVILTGVTGGRLDHYEANIRMIYRMQSSYPNIQFKIVNQKNEIRILLPGTHKIIRNETYQYLSFFAYGQQVENVTIRGVKYETTNETIEVGASRFTSNELSSAEGYISFSSGICLMIRSSD